MLVSSVDADCENNGYEEFECKCGEHYTVDVLAHGHEYEVVQNVEITRHIKLYLPNAISTETRTVSAITPRCFGNNRN